MFTRVAPFVVFMSFIAVDEGLGYLQSQQVVNFESTIFHWLYIPKAALTGLILLIFWSRRFINDFHKCLKFIRT